MNTVRRGEPADEPTLRALQSYLREPSSDLLTHALRTGDVLVSIADGAPVGYAVAVPGAGVHLAELVVHPDHRREGRAAELLRRVLADADGVVTLLVAPDNEPALALYRGLGFAVVGRRPDFYDDGDALVMAHDPGVDETPEGDGGDDADRRPVQGEDVGSERDA